MPDPLPKYDNPPVAETVLSVQFGRLLKFKTAHAGVFWREYLGEKWPTIEEAPRLEDQFEKFGDERVWGNQYRFLSQAESLRTQYTRDDNGRMIQLQDSRFLYNWKKGDEGYPSYETIKPEFDSHYDNFRKFCASSQLGSIQENQWEISYHNHIYKGDRWESLGDWQSIFPWLTIPQLDGFEKDSLVFRWSDALPQNKGRIHLHLAFGRVTPSIGATGKDAIILELISRGPISTKTGETLEAGFELGHSTIVKLFTSMTSKAAQQHWKRRY